MYLTVDIVWLVYQLSWLCSYEFMTEEQAKQMIFDCVGRYPADLPKAISASHEIASYLSTQYETPFDDRWVDIIGLRFTIGMMGY